MTQTANAAAATPIDPTACAATIAIRNGTAATIDEYGTLTPDPQFAQVVCVAGPRSIFRQSGTVFWWQFGHSSFSIPSPKLLPHHFPSGFFISSGKYLSTHTRGFDAAWPRPQIEASRIS